MKYRRLGRTGYMVSELGFGAWGIGGIQWIGAQDDTSLQALHRAADLGVNFFDSALAYGDGHSELLIAKFLKQRRDRIFIATKVPPKNWIWPAPEVSTVIAGMRKADHVEENCRVSDGVPLPPEDLKALRSHAWPHNYYD